MVASTTITGQSFIGSGPLITEIDPVNFSTPGIFASGNYSIEGALAIGTSTVVGLPPYGLQVMGTTTLALNSSARVGIGTAAPEKLLHLYSSGEAEIPGDARGEAWRR